MMMITILVLMTTMVKSEEKSITPKEFATSIGEVPSKLVTLFQTEKQKTIEYQTKVSSEAKTKWPWNVLLKGKDDTQN